MGKKLTKRALDTTSLPKFPTSWETQDENKLRYLEETLFNNIKSNSGKFAGIDFEKGLRELKKKVSPWLSAPEAEILFVNMFSKNVDNIFRYVKKIDFKTPKNGAVFYSGEMGKKFAWLYAYKHAGKAIEQTPGGSIFENWDWLDKSAFKIEHWAKNNYNDQALLWGALSKAYASQASGVAHVFQEKSGKIWENYEMPELMRKGVKFEIYKVPSNKSMLPKEIMEVLKDIK